MKFFVTRTHYSGYEKIMDEYPIIRGLVDNENGNCYFNCDNIEQLSEFQKLVGCPIILEGESIEIYDDYRE